MKLLAIDPGSNGGLALFNPEGCTLIEAVKMPPTPHDLLDYIRAAAPDVAYLEKVGGMPGNGGSQMFNFGRGYGHIEMALIAAGVRFITVTPPKWQKPFQLGTRGSRTPSQWKNILKEKAQQLFPRQRVTLWSADALLIGYYGCCCERQP